MSGDFDGALNYPHHILRFDSGGERLIKDDSKPRGEDFFPRGAITFFAVMIAVFGLIWLGIYALLLHRHMGL